MTTDKPLVNKVAKSGLITINLEEYYPKNQVVTFDLKDYLYMELILKEKEFRTALKEHDWTQYQDKVLCVFCSTDAIIPTWAYMLVTTCFLLNRCDYSDLGVYACNDSRCSFCSRYRSDDSR